VIVPLKPSLLVAVIVDVVEPPVVIETDIGLASSVKSGPVTLTVTVVLLWEKVVAPNPLMSTV
jgi:hypothetical protein